MENSVRQVLATPLVIEEKYFNAPSIAAEEPNVPFSFHIIDTPLSKKVNQYYKRCFDLVCCAFLIIPFFLLLPIISVLVKLSSKGPVFFLQKRNKKGGGVFTCIKFRTMRVSSARDHLPSILQEHRITKLGRILRTCHIDELPQVLNVLQGHMSVVGPRPHMLIDNERFDNLVQNYSARHSVKPGITGLAQVHGFIGPVLETEDILLRVKSDLQYIQNWTPALDVKIIYKSIVYVASIGVKKKRTGSNSQMGDHSK